MSSDKRINDANALSIERFRLLFVEEADLTFTSADLAAQLTIELQTSTQLSATDFAACFGLIEKTSRRDYEASTSIGWHPRRKQREMREPELRYLLVRGEGEDGGAPPHAFLSFMLTHDSSPSVPVLYVYEIHLGLRLRRRGLGAHLMRTAEDIARRVGVDRVMLTCFLTNERALEFYRRRGYGVDPCSPGDRTTRRKVVKAEYVIMSKSVARLAE